MSLLALTTDWANCKVSSAAASAFWALLNFFWASSSLWTALFKLDVAPAWYNKARFSLSSAEFKALLVYLYLIELTYLSVFAWAATKAALSALASAAAKLTLILSKTLCLFSSYALAALTAANDSKSLLSASICWAWTLETSKT